MAEHDGTTDDDKWISEPDTLSRRTWADIESEISNVNQGRAGGEFELDQIKDLRDAP
jgi:hypothetical protein